MNETTDEQLLAQWQAGDEKAATAIFARYTARLIGVVQQRISGRLRPRIDPESVVGSAMRSFLMRARDGQFEPAEDGDVWRLLVTICLNKVRNRARDAQAAKRDYRRELSGDASQYDPNLANVLCQPPEAEVAVMFTELIDSLLQRLDPLNQEIVNLRISGLTPELIGEQLTQRLTSRSVNRRLNGDILMAAQDLLNTSESTS